MRGAAQGLSENPEARPGLTVRQHIVGRSAEMPSGQDDLIDRHSSLHHLLSVLGELEALGIDFVSIDDAIDTRTPTGRLFMQMRGAFAEYERALIVERTKAGLEAARRRGKRLGRPPVTDRRKRERIVRLRGNGHTIPQIADLVSVSRATVERVVAAARRSA